MPNITKTMLDEALKFLSEKLQKEFEVELEKQMAKLKPFPKEKNSLETENSNSKKEISYQP